MTDTEKPVSDEKVTVTKNRNKRRMAWIALLSILVVTGLMMFVVDMERLDKLSDVVVWFYFSMASIIGAYMGMPTWAKVNGK